MNNNSFTMLNKYIILQNAYKNKFYYFKYLKINLRLKYLKNHL